MAYLYLFRQTPHLILFGLGLTVISSFGQTFFISLSADVVIEGLGVSVGLWGALYSAATLCSACTLPWVGRYLDRIPLPRFTGIATLGLAIACVLFSQARNPLWAFVALYLLRLTGQGLMGLTASTTMARAFDTHRGAALSVSSLGFSLGELVLPLVVPTALIAWGWRSSWVGFAAFIACVAIPALLALLRGARDRFPPEVFHPAHAVRSSGRHASWRLFRDLRFLALLPAYITSGFVATGLILYQSHLAASKGWTLEWMALAFSAFAVARLVLSLVVGPIIDRFQARRVFPFSLLPLLVGVALMVSVDAPWIVWCYYALMGASMGMGGAASSAMWAERYGVERLATIKSSTSMVAILGTAVSPALIGWALDQGVRFDTILLAVAGWIVLATVGAIWSLEAG